MEPVLRSAIIFGAVGLIPVLWSDGSFGQNAFSSLEGGGVEPDAFFFIQNIGPIVDGPRACDYKPVACTDFRDINGGCVAIYDTLHALWRKRAWRGAGIILVMRSNVLIEFPGQWHGPNLCIVDVQRAALSHQPRQDCFKGFPAVIRAPCGSLLPPA
jgi:hypothetical protein